MFKPDWYHTQTSKLQLTFAVIFALFSLILLYQDYKSILLSWYSNGSISSYYRDDLGTAQREAEKAIQNISKYPYPYLLLGKILGDSGDYKGAEKVLLDMLNTAETKDRKAIAYANISLANVYISQYAEKKAEGLLSSAKERLDEAQKYSPDNLDLSVSSGYIHLVRDHIGSAKRIFEQVLKTTELITLDSLVDLYVGLAICYFAEGNYKEARDYFQRAYLTKPTLKVLYGWYVYSIAKCIEAGIIGIEKFKEIKDEMVFRQYVSGLEDIVRSDSTLSYLKGVSYELYVAIGNLFTKHITTNERELEKAKLYFDLAMSIDRTRSEAYIGAALAYKKYSENPHLDEMARKANIRKSREYLEMFSRAFVDVKAKAVALNNAAVAVYEKLGSTRTAIEYLEDAIRIETENPIFFYNLGILYYKARDFDNAKINLQRSLQLDPNQPAVKGLLNTFPQ